MLDGWSDTHSKWIKMPAGPSLHARSRTAAPLAGCEYIFIKKRQRTLSLWLTFFVHLLISVTGTKMHVIMISRKNAVLFFGRGFLTYQQENATEGNTFGMGLWLRLGSRVFYGGKYEMRILLRLTKLRGGFMLLGKHAS